MSLGEFKKKFETLSSCEEKSRLALDFMRETLSQSGRLHMSDFWEAKRLCLEAFKGEIGSIKRSVYWKEFVELTDEAKRLKEILDEQTDFSCKQMELAVEVLQGDFSSFDLQQVPPITLSKGCKTLQVRGHLYTTIERRLTLLKSFAERYQALRDEAIKTEMRMGQRNRLLKKLSAVGDGIFSLRKELIEEVSGLFMADVDQFVQREFASLKEKAPFKARREIQLLQESAKKISLNRRAFTHCRKNLSESWELLQKDLDGKKDLFEENQAKIEAEIDAFLSHPPSDVRAIITRGEKLMRRLSSTLLAPESYKHLLLKLKKGQDEAVAQVKEEGEKSKKEAYEKIAACKQELAALIQKPDEKQLQRIRETVTTQVLSENDRIEIEHLLADAKEALLTQREETAIKENARELLSDLLSERQTIYRKLKDDLNLFRKKMESSHFDLEKAMVYRELYEAGKERLSRAEAALSRLESVCKS